MGMAAMLINESWPFVQIFNPPWTEGSKWNLKKTGPGIIEKKSVQKCGQMDGWRMLDGRKIMDDGRQVITIAHPELKWANKNIRMLSAAILFQNLAVLRHNFNFLLCLSTFYTPYLCINVLYNQSYLLSSTLCSGNATAYIALDIRDVQIKINSF